LAVFVRKTSSGIRKISVENNVNEGEMSQYINSLEAKVLTLNGLSSDIGSHSPHLATLHNFFSAAGQELLDDIAQDDVGLKKLDRYIAALQKIDTDDGRTRLRKKANLLANMKVFFLDHSRRRRAEVSSKAASGRLGIARAQEVNRAQGKAWIDIDAVVPEGQAMSRQQVERLMDINYEQRVEQNKVFDQSTQSDNDATRSTREVHIGARNLTFCTATFKVTLIGKTDLHVRTILDDMPELPLDQYVSIDEIKFDTDAWCMRVLTPFREPGDFLKPYKALAKRRNRADATSKKKKRASSEDEAEASEVQDSTSPADPSAARQDFLWQELGKSVADMVTVHFKHGSPFTSLPLQHGSFDMKYSSSPPVGFEHDFVLVVQEFLDGSDPEIRNAVVDPGVNSSFYEEREKLSTLADVPNGRGVEKAFSQLIGATVYRTSRPIFGIDWLVIEYEVIGERDFRRYIGVRVRDVNIQCQEPFEELLEDHRLHDSNTSHKSRKQQKGKTTLTRLLAQLMRTCDWSDFDVKHPYMTFGPFDPKERQQTKTARKVPNVPLSFLVYADGSTVCTSTTFASASISTKRSRRSVLTDAHAIFEEEKKLEEYEKMKNYNSPRARWHRAFIFAITRVKVESLKNMNMSLRKEVSEEVETKKKKGSLIKRLQSEAAEQVANEDWSEIQEATKGYNLDYGPTDIDWTAEETKSHMTYEATLDGYHGKLMEKKRTENEKLTSQNSQGPATPKAGK
jgi:hypothetical protein